MRYKTRDYEIIYKEKHINHKAHRDFFSKKIVPHWKRLPILVIEVKSFK